MQHHDAFSVVKPIIQIILSDDGFFVTQPMLQDRKTRIGETVKLLVLSAQPQPFQLSQANSHFDLTLFWKLCQLSIINHFVVLISKIT